jgi:hypothetical protein
MGARQETIDRYRHLRTLTKQHLGGALKHLSKNAIKEAARHIGLWSAGKLVLVREIRRSQIVIMIRQDGKAAHSGNIRGSFYHLKLCNR